MVTYDLLCMLLITGRHMYVLSSNYYVVTYDLLCMLLITGRHIDVLSSNYYCNWQKVSPSVFAMELWARCDGVLTAGDFFHEDGIDLSLCTAVQ